MVEFLSMLSGSSLLSVSVLGLGLLPFNLAGVVLALLVPFIPALQRRIQEDPREGRRWFEKWSYYLTAPAAVFESLLFLFLISPNCEGRLFLLEAGNSRMDILFTATTVTLLVAGSFFAIFIAGLISEFGIRGQGNVILIASGIIGQISNEFVRLLRTQIPSSATIEGSGLVPQLPQRIDSYLSLPGTFERLLAYVILFMLCILVVVYLQSGRRNVRIEYPSRSRIFYAMQRPAGMSRMPGATLPLMLTIGTDGLIGSQLFVGLTTFHAPLLTCTGIPWVNTAALWTINIFGDESIWFGPIAFISVVLFTYIYSGLIFERQNYGEHLQRTGAQILGVNRGSATQAYLSRINRRITLASALMLGTLAVAPWIFNMSFGVKLSLLEAEKLLIIVGVIRDVFMNIEVEMKISGYQEKLLI
jgi:preprotein translocase subunit SecY